MSRVTSFDIGLYKAIHKHIDEIVNEYYNKFIHCEWHGYHPDGVNYIERYAVLSTFKDSTKARWFEWNGMVKEKQIAEKEEQLEYYKEQLERTKKELEKLKS